MSRITSIDFTALARSLYPDWNQAEELTDYRPILRLLARKYHRLGMVYSEELDGFCFVAYRCGDRLGILEFAFGCCRDCDRLNACTSYAEVGFVIQQMIEAIEWFPADMATISLMRIRARLIVEEQVRLFEELVRGIGAG